LKIREVDKMAELYDEIETRPYLLYLNQINLPEVSSEPPEAEINNIAEGLGKRGVNFALPLVCLTDEEDQYQLLTGLPIYKAAEVAEVQKIWVFLIAAKQPEAEEAIEQALLQSRHNQRVEETLDEPSVSNKDFLEFVNDKKSDLTLISGLGKTSAKRIAENRPYTSLEDMQKKLGSKAPLKKWLKAYQQNDNLK
jgi:DNA uptake protein ComE-like DNA-binding protein